MTPLFVFGSSRTNSAAATKARLGCHAGLLGSRYQHIYPQIQVFSHLCRRLLCPVCRVIFHPSLLGRQFVF